MDKYKSNIENMKLLKYKNDYQYLNSFPNYKSSLKRSIPYNG